MTISTARLIWCFCSRTSLYTTAARSTARTPRRPAAYCTINSWTYISATTSTTSTTSTAGAWRGKNNYNRSKRQQPRRTMYHYSWWVLKRFWLLGYVNWPFKSKLHCLPRQHLFFFLTTDPQPGGDFNITPHSNLANVIILRSWTPCKQCGPLNLFAQPACPVEPKARNNLWRPKKPEFSFFSKRKVVE